MIVHTAGSVSGQSGTKVTGDLTSKSAEDDDDDVFLSNSSPTSPLPSTSTEPASPTSPAPITLQRSESTREPPKSPELIQELTKSNFGRSKSERKAKGKDRKLNGDEKPSSPAKSDTLKSTDSASGGETLEDRSSKEGSPTKEHPSPSKDKQKQKKKKFRMPSFGKAKNKESKESAI